MSDTPETDSRIGIISNGSNVVDASWARHLERERNEARAELERCKDVLLVIAERDQLRKVADELAYELKDLRLSYVGLGGELALARIESKINLYNQLPHVIERNKAK